MTYDVLGLLVDYNYWARDRILDAVSALTPEQFTKKLGNSFSSIRDTIAHICDAESIWIRRWNGEQPLGFQNPERMPDSAAAREEWPGWNGRCANCSKGWDRKPSSAQSNIRTCLARRD